MALKLYDYQFTGTAGTKVKADASDLIIPANYAGITRIGKQGANSESLRCQFPGGEHRFAEENVYCGGEIAVETRVEPWLPKWAGWQLPEKTKVDIIPDGVESATEGRLIVEFGTSDEFIYPPLHHEKIEVTLGTVVENEKLLTIPQGCNLLYAAMIHGAGLEMAGIKLKSKGEVYSLIGNHAAIEAGTIQLPYQILNLPLESDGLYWSNDTTQWTGTAVQALYLLFLYD